jgi:hypothetical protein
MRRNSIFWAGLLILLGLVLLLGNLGVFDSLGVNVWMVFWPLVLIAVGIWFLWGTTRPRGEVRTEQVTIPLSGATRARVRVQHGAGRLHIGGGTEADVLAAGSFGGGLDYRTRQDGDMLDVDMRIREQNLAWAGPWNWHQGLLDWSFNLNQAIPLDLSLETGANETVIDMKDLRVTSLTLKTGASSTDVALPANAGLTQAKVQAGAASVVLRVPTGVAARIYVSSGLAGIEVDGRRFPRVGDHYESPDYGTATNRVNLDIEAGVGSVTVR